MAIIRAEVTTQLRQTDPPRDFQTNTIFFDVTGTFTTAAWQAMADGLKNIFYSATGFGGSNPWTNFASFGGQVILYNMADPKPRPELAVSKYTPGSWFAGSLADRSVALCLSFYSDRNLPRQRGRIYVGGWLSNTTNERPSTAATNALLDLAKGIYTFTSAGGLTMAHTVYSKVGNTSHAVNHYWTNDVWDVQRSRSPKETTRYKYLP
jgi:hypothetical protein